MDEIEALKQIEATNFIQVPSGAVVDCGPPIPMGSDSSKLLYLLKSALAYFLSHPVSSPLAPLSCRACIRSQSPIRQVRIAATLARPTSRGGSRFKEVSVQTDNLAAPGVAWHRVA